MTPAFPVALDDVNHVFGSFMEPISRALPQVFVHCRNGFFAAEVDIRCLPAHGVEEPMLIIPAGEAFHFDSRAIGRQPADKPITNGANERIALYFFTYSTWSGRRSLYVEDLFVRAQFRGKGIGKALFQRMAEVASEQHCQGMRWEVLSWNSPAVEFYRSVGAEILREWWPVRLIGDAFKELGEGLRPRE